MKKSLMTIGIMAAFVVTTASVMAESTIYTDGLGRIHFLGKDAASNSAVRADYANPEQQDLTRKLYENSTGELKYVDRPLKDYENTFSDSRYTNWKKKYESDIDGVKGPRDYSKEKVKGSFTAEKGVNDASTNYGFANVNIDQKSLSNTNAGEEKKSSKWFKRKNKQ